MWQQYPSSDTGLKTHVLITLVLQKEYISQQVKQTNAWNTSLNLVCDKNMLFLGFDKNPNIFHVLPMQPPNGSQVELNMP